MWTIGPTLLQVACTRKVTAPVPFSPPVSFVVPDSVQSIFDDNCVGCHAGASPAGGLDLSPDSSFAALVDVPSLSCSPLVRVRPSEPDNSCLMLRLTGATTPQMPLGGQLTTAQIDVVRGWIEQGAGPAIVTFQTLASTRRQVHWLEGRLARHGPRT